MASAPAGWYKDPSAPGIVRYWDGVAWLASGERPAVAAMSFAPQPSVFMPSATVEPVAEFRPTTVENHASPPLSVEPPVQRATVDALAAAGHDDVTWDVVGVPRQSENPASNSSPQPEWSPGGAQGYGVTAAQQGYGRAGDPGAYAPSLYAPQQALPPYGSSALGRKRVSGLAKIATVVATVVIGFGLRWAIGLFFGGDFSDDGRIEVATPDYWTTSTVNNPDLTYAMDPNWADIKSTAGSGLSGEGSRLIEVRSVSTDFTGKEAIVVMVSTSFSVPGAKASREDFAAALDAALNSRAAPMAGNDHYDEIKILKSAAGDRWGFTTGHISFEGVAINDYVAIGIIDGYAVAVQLIVPDGVGLTQNDILGVVNSIKAR